MLKYVCHWLFGVCGGLLTVLLVPALPGYAHGVTVEHNLEQTATVSLVARYDSGEPMANAQVTIYAPNDPATPWDTGTCDDAGTYQFAPDPTLVGTWTVQVRQAGHGETIYIEVGNVAASPERSAMLLPTSGDLPYTPLQMLLMGGAIVWGCIGTAFFFASRRG